MAKSVGGTIASLAHLIAAAMLVVALALGLAAIPAGPSRAAGDPLDGTEAQEKPRIAFVLGNNDYQTLKPLRNAVNDGKLIAAGLKRLKFTVVEGYDLTLAQMLDMFREHRALIDGSEAVVFYFAGHGFQLGGTNYLVPTDAALTSAIDIPAQTVTLNAVIKELESADRPLLIFLDACRENPLRGTAAGGGELDGLAQIDAGLNTFVAFAAEPGAKTNDGAGINSPFAQALANNIETPGLSISDLTISVRNETLALTLDRQIPWSQESLRAQFFFTERQPLDPAALRLAANEIVKDPRQFAAFLEARDQLGYQGAIMLARQRGSEVLGQSAPLTFDKFYAGAGPTDGAATAASDGTVTTTEIASTAPTTPVAVGQTSATGQASVGDVSGGQTSGGQTDALETLLFARLNDGKVEVASPEDVGTIDRTELAHQLQTELRRLGCYRLTVDGDWGPGSRNALQQYVRQTREEIDGLEPSVDTLKKTLLRSGRVCRAPVEIIRRKERPAGAGAGGRAAPTQQVERQRPRRVVEAVPSFRRREKQGFSLPAQRERREQRRHALPPDLQGGVGIGF